MKGRARDSAVAEHRSGVVLFRILLVAVIVLAFVLRLRGIHWGLRVLPYFPYFLNYHPDEVGNTMQCISGMNPATMDFNPHNFVNPSLYFYVGGMALYLLSLVSSVIVSPFSPGKLSGDQISTLFLMGRLVAVSVGVLSVYIVYEAARRLYSKPVGLLSALFRNLG